MKISGFVFLIIGALVLSVSLFKKQLIFFTYIGALSILYGVFKMVFKWITNTSPAEIKGYNLNRQIPNTLNVHPKNVQRTQMYKCRRCGSMVFLHSNFCSICGLRLK